jgi:hypothetical protein
MLWLLAGILFALWGLGLLLGKGGFLHMLLLAGLAVVVVQVAYKIRAAQGN